MKRMMERLRSGIIKLRDKGFFHIFIGNTLVKCVSLCSAVFLPRILVPESVYGMLTTVDNLNAYLILINGIGLSNSVLRFCSMREKSKENTAIFNFCLKFGLVANAAILLIYIPLILFSPVFSGDTYGVVKPFLLVSCMIPVFTFVQDVAMLYMRANLLNKAYSQISVVYTLMYAGFQIMLAYFFSLNGVFAGRYIALSLSVFFCFLILVRKKTLSTKCEPLPISLKKEIVFYGIGAMITNLFSLIMPQNETLVVNLVLQDLTTTAYYKAASMIPSNLQYIATSVVVFIFPYFAKQTGKGMWIKRHTVMVVLGMLALMVPIIVIGYILTPAVINMIYGASYEPAIEIMKPMWIAFGVNAVLRIPVGNILAALGELKFNIILSAVISVLHLVLDYFFISQIGIGGAAYALMIAYTVSGICSIAYLLCKCKNSWRGDSKA